jgi:probable phosphoglycerate mutase
MRQITELETHSSPEVARWRGSMTVRPPGGESVMDLQNRVWAALDELIENYRTKTVVVSTHMMPTRAFAAAAYKSEESYWGLGTSPAGVSIYRFFGRSLTEIFLQNYCAHLMRS